MINKTNHESKNNHSIKNFILNENGFQIAKVLDGDSDQNFKKQETLGKIQCCAVYSRLGGEQGVVHRHQIEGSPNANDCDVVQRVSREGRAQRRRRFGSKNPQTDGYDCRDEGAQEGERDVEIHERVESENWEY